jgi:hypothetical protein
MFRSWSSHRRQSACAGASAAWRTGPATVQSIDGSACRWRSPNDEPGLRRNNCCELKTGAQAPINPAKREPPCCIDGVESFGAMAIMTGTLVPHVQGIGTPRPVWLLSTSQRALRGTFDRITQINSNVSPDQTVFRKRNTVCGSILLLVIGVVVALAFSTSIDSIYQTALGARSNVDLSDSDSIRAATVPLAVRVGIEYPLLGIGDGNFQAFAEDSESIGTAVNTHNDYLRLFAEFGLPGLVALILMLASGLSRAVRSESAALVMPVLIVFLVSLLFGNHLSALAVSGGFWVLLGVAASLPRIRPVGHATYGQVARFAT